MHLLFACLQIVLAGVSLFLMSTVLCEKQQAEEKSDVGEKKHEKRGIFDEGYGDFGGDFGHSFEEDHHHVHHHHEKTIVDVKKVLIVSSIII